MNQIRGFAPLLFVVLTIIGGYFFTYPQWSNLSENKTSLVQIQEENAKLKKSETDLNTFLSEYRSKQNQSDFAGKILPLKKPELESFLANLDSFATSSGVSLSSASFADQGLGTSAVSTKSTDYQIAYVDVTMSASGSYPSFRAFISQLENSLRLMDILTVSIVNGNDPSKLEYKFIGRVYYQK